MSEKGLEGSVEKAKKLWLENYCIMQENERLRKKAKMLKEENEALLVQIKRYRSNKPCTSSGSNPNSTSANAAAPNPNSLHDLSRAQAKAKNGAIN